MSCSEGAQRLLGEAAGHSALQEPGTGSCVPAAGRGWRSHPLEQLGVREALHPAGAGQWRGSHAAGARCLRNHPHAELGTGESLHCGSGHQGSCVPCRSQMLEESWALQKQGASGAVPLQELPRGVLGLGKQTSLSCSVSPAPPTNAASPVPAGRKGKFGAERQ